MLMTDRKPSVWLGRWPFSAFFIQKKKFISFDVLGKNGRQFSSWWGVSRRCHRRFLFFFVALAGDQAIFLFFVKVETLADFIYLCCLRRIFISAVGRISRFGCRRQRTTWRHCAFLSFITKMIREVVSSHWKWKSEFSSLEAEICSVCVRPFITNRRRLIRQIHTECCGSTAAKPAADGLTVSSTSDAVERKVEIFTAEAMNSDWKLTQHSPQLTRWNDDAHCHSLPKGNKEQSS